MKFRGSIARPVSSPVNASARPSRVLPHDSGSVWFATPSLCDSFIHYAMPVSRRFRLFFPNCKANTRSLQPLRAGARRGCWDDDLFSLLWGGYQYVVELDVLVAYV